MSVPPLPTVSGSLGVWGSELNTYLQQQQDRGRTGGDDGPKLTQDALNIDGDVSMGTGRLTQVRSVDLASSLTDSTGSNSIFADSTGNLKYRDSAGSTIFLTSASAIAAPTGSLNVYNIRDTSADVTIQVTDPESFFGIGSLTTRNVNLPLASAVPEGRFYFVHDISGTLTNRHVNIVPAGTNRINNSSSYQVEGLAMVVRNEAGDGWYANRPGGFGHGLRLLRSRRYVTPATASHTYDPRTSFVVVEGWGAGGQGGGAVRVGPGQVTVGGGGGSGAYTKWFFLRPTSHTGTTIAVGKGGSSSLGPSSSSNGGDSSFFTPAGTLRTVAGGSRGIVGSAPQTGADVKLGGAGGTESAAGDTMDGWRFPGNGGYTGIAFVTGTANTKFGMSGPGASPPNAGGSRPGLNSSGHGLPGLGVGCGGSGAMALDNNMYDGGVGSDGMLNFMEFEGSGSL